MKRGVLILLALCLGVLPCRAENYRIAVMQVSDVEAFRSGLDGFLSELAKEGLSEGKNLTIKRYIIKADPAAGLWKKLFILRKIKTTAAEIAADKPDLCLTLGTPATKYGKDKIIEAGIPLVFTMVLRPEVVGAKSLDTPGPGFTGSCAYVDPKDVLQIAKQALPNLKKLGMVHCDDDNAIFYANDTKTKGAALGIQVLTKQVEKSDPIGPALNALIGQGVDAFGVPPDTYYDLDDGKAVRDLAAISRDKKIPAFSFVTHSKDKGAVFYIGCDFHNIGAQAGSQAVKILRNRVKPETLPIYRQRDLTIVVDTAMLKYLGITLPTSVLMLAKPM
ncbi:MAG TPA: ABC transporter substrate-binding protein [Syntrophorhabdaceae bacterium]|nr:ABC transporter substrate-binding protein [Syntrophorhabdaceae bacterium]HPA07245.1 ABC transporter substrate-binding protein [Methanoregulaceae archaeon]